MPNPFFAGGESLCASPGMEMSGTYYGWVLSEDKDVA